MVAQAGLCPFCPQPWSKIFLSLYVCLLLQVKGVLVGFDPHLSYIKMIKGASYANNPKNLFIATNEDSYLPTPEDHIVIPGNQKTQIIRDLMIKE